MRIHIHHEFPGKQNDFIQVYRGNGKKSFSWGKDLPPLDAALRVGRIPGEGQIEVY